MVKIIKPLINYVGWIGHGNLGDEGLFLVNNKIFKPYIFKNNLAILRPINKYLYHLGIIPWLRARATYTPFITLEYRPKCRAFIDSLDYKEYIIRTDNVTCEKILDMVYRLEADWDIVNKLLINKVNFYREKLINSSEEIKKDIQNVYPLD